MHEELDVAGATRWWARVAALLIPFTLATAPWPSANAQEAGALTKAPTILLVDVVLYRHSWIEPRTPLDLCAFRRLMAEPSGYPARVPSWLVASDSLSPCRAVTASVEPGSYTPPFDAVVLDSVSLRDT